MNDEAVSSDPGQSQKGVSSRRAYSDHGQESSWQQQQESVPVRKASSAVTSASRWSDTIRKVLRGSEDQADEDELERDAVGAEVTRLINASATFKRPQHNGVMEDRDMTTRFNPLLSSRNIKRAYRWVVSLRPRHVLELFRFILNACYTSWKNAFRERTSVFKAVRVFVLLLLGSLVLFVTMSVMLIKWAIRNAILYGTWMASLVFDLEELKSSCPTIVKRVWGLVIGTGAWFDDNVLFRRRIAGREWNDDEFVWRGSGKSRGETLLKCPPPSVMSDFPRSTQLWRKNWSPDTINHIVALEFCHDILHKDKLRKQASQRRKAMKRASSGPVGDSKSTNRRAELMISNKARSEHSVQFSSPTYPVLSPIEQGQFDFLSDDEAKRTATLSPPETGVSLLNLSDGESVESLVGSSSFRDTDGELGDESSLDSDELRHAKHRNANASVCSDTGPDMNWLDVGTSIGFRLLNSEHVQKAIASQDTAERIMDMNSKLDPDEKELPGESFLAFNTADRDKALSPDRGVKSTPQRPVHSMWTSPSAAEANGGVSVSSISDLDDSSLASDIPSPPVRRRKSLIPEMRKHIPPRSTMTSNGDRNVGKGKRQLEDHSVDAMPWERRDETEIYIDNQVNSMQDSPRISEAVETSIARKRPVAALSPDLYESKALTNRRATLVPGMKLVVPLLPLQPSPSCGARSSAPKRTRRLESQFQMATVVSSKRIYIPDPASPRKFGDHRRYSNCLSVSVALDRSFLRNGEFAQMTFRVMDKWSSRFMPKHSKFPIGTCVATSFGLGVLVSWRVEDDCHVVRSLWQRKGPGRAYAYLNRDAIHDVVEASVGFDVETRLGRGTIVAYVNGGRAFRSGRYFVHLTGEGRHQGNVFEFNRTDILKCDGAQFIPIIEYIREAAQYQIQVDNYNAAVRRQHIEVSVQPSKEDSFWTEWSQTFEVFWESFLKAVEEDSEFDAGISEFVSSLIDFLERIDKPQSSSQSDTVKPPATDELELPGDTESCVEVTSVEASTSSNDDKLNGFWILDGLFGGVFQRHASNEESKEKVENIIFSSRTSDTEETLERQIRIVRSGHDMSGNDSYRRVYAVLRVLLRTVAIARASCADKPNLSLALSTIYELLLFVRTFVKVHQTNVSQESVAAWRRTLAEIVATFGPAKERMAKIGRGIAERIERQGKKAKIRILRLVDLLLVDEQLLSALEEGHWDVCLERIECDLVKAKVIDSGSRDHYRKCLIFMYDHLVPVSRNDSAAARNNKKLAHFAKALKWMASPRRSFLGLIMSDDVLEIVERMFVRVFRKEEVACRMLNIHASNFYSFRHLRMLNDFTISGRLWMPLLDAADEEFAWAGSRMPDNTRGFVSPLSKLFSLGVTQFHRKHAGDMNRDWLDFLMEDEAVKLIHEIDTKLILGLGAFCNDVKEVMTVLPYYHNIDEDILNLIDEVNVDEFLKELSGALGDPEGLGAFLKEKATIGIERFLDYLPKMSIPVERREIGDDWVITCRSESGGDLKLSDVTVERENMICQIVGSGNVLFPMFGGGSSGCPDPIASSSSVSVDSTEGVSAVRIEQEETSVLDDIRALLLNAQNDGCWRSGVGGVGRAPSDPYVRSVLKGLPVSTVLNCGFELWRNLEIDDDELLEIAIRDVSYQIQLKKDRELGLDSGSFSTVRPQSSSDSLEKDNLLKFPFGRFNPRMDPTVLYLEMNKLTLNLDSFMFRIEKAERRTILDPVFDGCGSLSIHNVSIKLRVECRKDRILKLGTYLTVPILVLSELDVRLAQVRFKVKSTGADWFLNKVVDGFSENISRVVESNLKEQVSEQLIQGLNQLNAYFEVNPELILNMLGIHLDDLEEASSWI